MARYHDCLKTVHPGEGVYLAGAHFLDTENIAFRVHIL